MRQSELPRTGKLPKSGNGRPRNYRGFIGIIALSLSALLMLIFAIYMHKHWAERNLLDPDIIYRNPARELGLLRVAQWFFDKLGLCCWALGVLLMIYGWNRIGGNRVFRFKRYFFRILLIIFYGNLLTGFLLPRYRFPYSGALGKVMASWCMETLGVWLTMLLVLLVLPYGAFKLWKQGII